MFSRDKLVKVLCLSILIFTYINNLLLLSIHLYTIFIFIYLYINLRVDRPQINLKFKI